MNESSITERQAILSNEATYQIIWLLAQGKLVREVAEVTGYCAYWMRILVWRHDRDCPKPSLISASIAEVLQHCSPPSKRIGHRVY